MMTMGREVTLRVELGRRLLSVEEAAGLDAGSVLELEALADDSVDVYVGGRLCARGRAVVIDGNLAVRIEEMLARPSCSGRV